MAWSTLRYLLTAGCRDASRVASEECDGPVSPVDRWAARLHRVACGPCRRSRDQIRLVDRLMRSAAAHECLADDCAQHRLSDDAAARMRGALAHARGETGEG